MIGRIIFGLILVILSVIGGIWLQKYEVVNTFPSVNSALEYIERRLSLNVDQYKQENLEKDTEFKSKFLLDPSQLKPDSIPVFDRVITFFRPVSWTVFYTDTGFNVFSGTFAYIDGEIKNLKSILVGEYASFKTSQELSAYIQNIKTLSKTDGEETLVNSQGESVIVLSSPSRYDFIFTWKSTETSYNLVRMDYDYSTFPDESARIINFI